MENSQNKYTNPDMQNEMLGIMALHILRDASNEVSGKWFIIMIDETTALSSIAENYQDFGCCRL